MRPSRFVEKTVWPRHGLAGWLGYAALAPMSVLFGAGVGLRGLAYRVRVLRVRRAPLVVISVGNLAVGGTGKTPFTLWLARTLLDHGLRTGILLRGYGGSRSGVTVVSRGDRAAVDPAAVGDEAVMLAKSFDGVVITAARRIDGATAAAELGCEVVVLDDGFQHRAIARDLDFVLLDGQRRALLPAGPLRERPCALARADVIILVEPDPEAETVTVPPSVAGKAVHRMRVGPAALVRSTAGRWEELPLSLLAGKQVVAVSGIAHPQRFFELLGQWGAVVQEVFEYGDHHRYAPADWQEIARRSHRADLVVTTEKDLVKLEAFPFATGKLVALRVRPLIEQDEELIGRVLKKVRAASDRTGSADRDRDPAEPRGVVSDGSSE